jgi:hypothetical protein
MQSRTPLNAAAPLVAGALLGFQADSVRLATPVRAADKPAASAELDRTVRPVFVLANQPRRWELNDLARRSDNQADAGELCEGLVPAPVSSISGASRIPFEKRGCARAASSERSPIVGVTP